ncbi:MAG TPA: efflux RND transporter periplasmic adaptor subunit [Thermoanaerobaculia bacterium]|nr:efflux RND transporter periplasmic adaptor subunit [Thermoanaerobaculia bacterium]
MKVDRNDLDALRIDRGSHVIPRRTRAWLAIAVAAVVVLALVLWFRRPAAPLVQVAVAQALQRRGEATALNATGYVTARRQATVSSKVTGKVVEVLVEEGMTVKEGEILARLDPATPSATLRLAQAQASASESALRETTVRIEEATLELRRAESLARQQVSSQADLDAARAQLDALRARLEAQRDELGVARRNIDVRRRDFEDTIIRAPFDGVVVSKNAQPGEMISPVSGGGFTRTGICTIVDMSSLEVEVDVNEAYINRVSPGQRVRATLDAYPDWSFAGHVITVVPAADRQKATVRVRIGIDEPDARILPDMGVKVAFLSDEGASATSGGVTVPRAALRREGETDLVFAVKDGKAERRAVAVGAADGDRVTLLSGISPGERVIVGGPADLDDGTAVRVADRESA